MSSLAAEPVHAGVPIQIRAHTGAAHAAEAPAAGAAADKHAAADQDVGSGLDKQIAVGLMDVFKEYARTQSRDPEVMTALVANINKAASKCLHDGNL